MEDGPPRFPQGFSCPVVLGCLAGATVGFAYRTVTFFGSPFLTDSTNEVVCNSVLPGPTTPVQPKLVRFGLVRVRSPLLTESLLFSLPGGTEMVHFPPFASAELCVHSVMAGYCPAGLPHSEIPGSKPACGSPRLIAAYRVLHRLSAPRHPPCTLSSLTKLEVSLTGESYRF